MFSYRYLPLSIYIGYSILVIVCFFLAPIEYKNIDLLLLVAFIATFLLLFAGGYILGARAKVTPPRVAGTGRFPDRSNAFRRLRWLVHFMLVAAVVGAVVQIASLYAAGSRFDLQAIGEAYVESYSGYVRGQAAIDFAYILDIFRQAASVLAVLFGIYYYHHLGRAAKLALVFIVVSYLLINVVGSGKQKYLGDIVVFVGFGAMLNLAAKSARLTAKTIAISVGAFLLVFGLFVEILRQRYNAADIGLDNINSLAHPLITWDENALIFSIFGEDYGFALGQFLGYFTMGLYGLYLSLSLPFQWSFFIGNSYSLGRIFEIALDKEGVILERTYPFRVGEEFGWGFDKWHSLFAWLASDLTFLGVLLITPVFSYWYARLWISAINADNSFSGPLFIFLSLGLIFSYANNQLFHALAGVIVVFTLSIGWYLQRFWSRPTRQLVARPA